MSTTNNLADQVQGRIISAHIDIMLAPPASIVGDTDAAVEAGHLLVDGALRLLQQAAERNGFKVQITVVQVIY